MKKLIFLLLIISTSVFGQSKHDVYGPIWLRYSNGGVIDSFKVYFSGINTNIFTTKTQFNFNKTITVNQDPVVLRTVFLDTTNRIKLTKLGIFDKAVNSELLAGKDTNYIKNNWGGVTPTNSLLEWNGTNKWYAPYSSKQASMSFYTGTDNPTLNTRLNLDANLVPTMISVYGGIIQSETTSGQAIYGVATTNGSGVYGSSSSGQGGFFVSSSGEALRALAPSSGYGLRIIQSNNSNTSSKFIQLDKIGGSGSYNYTGDFIVINDNPVNISGTISGKVLSATIGSTERISLNPRFTPGTGGSSYLFDTHSSITATGDNIFDFKTNGASKVAYTGDNWLKINGSNFVRLDNSASSSGSDTWNIAGQLNINSSNATKSTVTISSGRSTSLNILHRSISGDNTGSVFTINRSASSSYNMTGDLIAITDGGSSLTTGTISGKVLTVLLGSSGSDVRTERISFDPRTVDGASAIAYLFDTHNNLTTTGAKLASFKNQGVEKSSIDKDGIFTFKGTYASIFRHKSLGDTTQSIPNGTTPTKVLAFSTNGEQSNCTADKTNDKITITKPGRYMVNLSLSYASGTNAVNWTAYIFNGGVECENIHSTGYTATANDKRSTSLSGIINVTSVPCDIDYRVSHSHGSSVDLIMTYVNLNVNYIGE